MKKLRTSIISRMTGKILTHVICVRMYIYIYIMYVLLLLWCVHHRVIKNRRKTRDRQHLPRACACSNRSLKFHDINGAKKHGRNAASRDVCVWCLQLIYVFFFILLRPTPRRRTKTTERRRVNIPTGGSPPPPRDVLYDYRNRVHTRRPPGHPPPSLVCTCTIYLFRKTIAGVGSYNAHRRRRSKH